MQRVRIFISSPGDVAAEREKAREVIARLQPRYAGRLVLEPVLWEDLPLEASMSFQEGIDLVVSDEHGIDIAVFILWSRLGSPLGTTVSRPDGGTYRSGTEREFELMLAAHKQSGGARPHLLAYVRRDETEFKQRLSRTDRTELAELVAQQDQAEAFIQEHFHDADTGTNIRAYHNFGKPVDFAGRLRVHLLQVLDQLLGESTAVVWDTAVKGSPFRGLEAFDMAHADVYFGREQEVCELQESLRRQAADGCGLVLVVGASGSGKSSLVRAGLVPTLQTFDMEEGMAGWRQAALLPSEGDGDLCGALAAALRRPDALPELLAAKEADLADYLRRDPDTAWRLILRDVVTEAEQAATGKLRLLLLVDQFEEVFTQTSVTAAERAAFVRALGALAAGGSVHVVATVRSDFYAQCQGESGLMALVKDGGIMNLLPPSSQALHRMIQRPAVNAGLRFEAPADGTRSLDERILQDAAADPQALPLLSYCLQELYDACQRQSAATAGGGPTVLTHAAYEALGGVAGAVGSRAEAVYLALPEDQRACLTGVLQALVTVRDDDAQATRHRAPLADLTASPAQRALVEAFVAARLFTTDQDDADQSVVAVSHEAILHAWDRAARWIDDNREFLKTRARVAAAAQLWDTNARDAAYLLPAGKPLAEAEALLARRADLTPLTAAHIDASITHQHALAAKREKDQQERLAEREAAAAALAVAATERETAALRLRRRTRIALVLGLLLTTAATIAAITAHHQRQTARTEAARALAAEATAEANATRATAARADAEDLVNFVIFDMRDKLSPVGRLDILDVAAQKALAYYTANPPAPDDTTALRQFSAAHQTIGDILTAQGKLDDALAAYQAAMVISKDLSSRDSTNTQWQRDLCVNHNNIGNVLTVQGKLDDALAAYYAAMAIAKDLSSRDPSNTDWQRDLSISHINIGDILAVQGNLDDALAAYRAAEAIDTDLLRREPDNADWRRDLSVSQNNIGDLLTAQGKLDDALAAYQAAMVIRQDLSSRDPSNTQWQRDLSVSHINLGDLLTAQGNVDEALIAYQAAMAIAKDLAARDPSNTDWQRDLSVSHNNIGDFLAAQGELDAALAAYQSSLAIRQGLASRDPSNMQWQRDLSVSHEKIGDVQIANDKLDDALASYQASMVIRQDLSSRDPSNTDWLRHLSVSHEKIGDVLAAKGSLDDALAAYLIAMTIAQDLAARDPGNTLWITDYVISLYKVGTFSATGRDVKVEYLAEALLIAGFLAQQDGLNAGQTGWPALLTRLYREARDARGDGEAGPWEQLVEAADDAERLQRLRAQNGRPPWARLWEKQLAGDE